MYGELQETIYMKLPQGMETTQSDADRRVKKSFYGLKQAVRVWNNTFIVVYVDDMVVFFFNETKFQEIMAGL